MELREVTLIHLLPVENYHFFLFIFAVEVPRDLLEHVLALYILQVKVIPCPATTATFCGGMFPAETTGAVNEMEPKGERLYIELVKSMQYQM